MKFAVYGICPETRRGKFLALMDAENPVEIFSTLGVAHLQEHIYPHPNFPDCQMAWRGHIGLAIPQREQYERRVNHSFTLAPSEVEFAKLLGNGNASEGIRRALLLAVADGG